MKLSRRSLFAATTALAMPRAAFAQERSRYGIPMTDIPLTAGQPTARQRLPVYPPHDLRSADRLETRPVGPAGQDDPGAGDGVEGRRRRRGPVDLQARPGVKFHDGSEFDADAVIWNFEKVFNKDAPQFDTRQSAQVGRACRAFQATARPPTWRSRSRRGRSIHSSRISSCGPGLQPGAVGGARQDKDKFAMEPSTPAR